MRLGNTGITGKTSCTSWNSMRERPSITFEFSLLGSRRKILSQFRFSSSELEGWAVSYRQILGLMTGGGDEGGRQVVSSFEVT